jgi:hypothetical protein
LNEPVKRVPGSIVRSPAALALCLLGLLAASHAAAVGAQPAAPALAAQPGRTATPESTPPPAEEIFTRARTAWRRRTVPPFTRYKITALYEASGKTFREDFHCFYRLRDQHLTAFNVPVPPEENQKRLRGIPISILAITIDTNPVEHPPIKIPTPQIVPYAQLGLGTPGSQAAEDAAAVLATPSPAPLVELGRVVTVNRTYAVTYNGIERVRDTDTYHLSLKPLRDPRANKLRELWADTQTFDVVRLEVSGVDALEPLGPDAARIDLATVDGRRVIARIAALEALQGYREVHHLVFFFREYEFPERENLEERYGLNFTPPPR